MPRAYQAAAMCTHRYCRMVRWRWLNSYFEVTNDCAAIEMMQAVHRIKVECRRLRLVKRDYDPNPDARAEV